VPGRSRVALFDVRTIAIAEWMFTEKLCRTSKWQETRDEKLKRLTNWNILTIFAANRYSSGVILSCIVEIKT